MAEVKKRTLRTKLETNLALPSTVTLETWRANATDIQVAIYDADGVAAITDIQSVNCKVQPSQLDDTTLMDSTVAAASMDADLTDSEWVAGTDQHATFSFTNSETNLALTLPSLNCWIVFTATLTGGEEVTLAAGTLTIHEDNNAAGDPPATNPGTAITIEEADARYLQSMDWEIKTDDFTAVNGGRYVLNNAAKAFMITLPDDVPAHTFEIVVAQWSSGSLIGGTTSGTLTSSTSNVITYNAAGAWVIRSVHIPDVYSRSNHTGTQLLSTISDAGTSASVDVEDLPVSTAQRAAIDAEIVIAKDASFVFVGDSITAGTGGQTDPSWSTTIQTLSNFTARGTFTNKAVSGDKKADMVADYATEVEPLKPGAGETVYLLGMIGINDVAGGTLTTTNVATWFAELETYWTTAKADGFKIVWSTMTTRNGLDPVINTVSRLMLASDIPDIIIDGNQLLPNANDTRYYLGDKLHLTELGGRILAEAINEKMTSGAGRAKDPEWRRTQNNLTAGEYIAWKPTLKQLAIGDVLDGNSALVSLNGTNARVVFSRQDGTALTSCSAGVVGSAGAGASGSISYDLLLTSQEARGIAFGVSSSGTQAVRWRLEPNGVWRASRTTSTTDYSQAGSSQFGLASASGSHVIGSIRNDFLMVAPSGNSIIFGTEEGTSTQTTRMRIKADGSVKLNEGPEIHTGSGTPEAAVTAPVGSTFHRTDGGAGTSFYVKESGTGNTGWAAK